jgi:hypothetical protein
MEAVATIGAHGLSIDNNSLQGMLKDEVKIAFDNATGNEIFARKYKVKKSAEGRVGCIVKDCPKDRQDIKNLQLHCMRVHEISFSFRGEFILHIELKQRKIDGPHMSSEDARSIKYLPKSVSVSNDCAKAAGIIEESSFSKDNNDLQYRLKDEVINAFENYIDDNNYGSQYKISIVDNEYECIIKGCNRSYKSSRSWRGHCLKDHKIRLAVIGKYIMSIEKVKKDNTNATKTTTDNMDSNRKRSHSPDIHEEESNAKKAMLNPSESGYLQSALSRSNYNLEPLSWHDDLLSITEYNSVDDTPVTGNNDLITTDVQPSATSQDIDDTEILELARELAENNSDFQDALNKDVADKYATSRDSYL